MAYHIMICFIRISHQRTIPPLLMSEHLYCPYCVFSDRNFIVPLLHPNVHLIERHPFVYRYCRLPSGYTLHLFYSSYPYLFDFVGICIYFTQHRKQQRADIIGIEGSKGIMFVEGIYYIYKLIKLLKNEWLQDPLERLSLVIL